MQEDQPQRPFVPVQDEVRRLFYELIHQPWGGRGREAASQWQPSADMGETPEALIVEVELPGVQPDDVRVDVVGDMLHITGERRATTRQEGRSYYRVERSYGRFERRLRLPQQVNREAIRAEFHDGLLTITLPKRGSRAELPGTQPES